MAAPFGIRRRSPRRILPDGRLPGLLGDARRRAAAAGLHHTRRRWHGVGSDSMSIAVIGAGPAGVRAVQALLARGLRPVWIDEAPQAGGQIYRRPPKNF